MADLINLLLNLVIFLVLLCCGLFVGKYMERKHIRALNIKERELSDIRISDLRKIPANWKVEKSFLVTGSVVIATDYFKVVASAIRNLFGGEMKSYESLLERGYREAKVRMLEEARSGGANAVWNVRFETANIHGETKKAGGVELIAYGTAMKIS